MEASGIEPDLITFGAAINACSRGGKVDVSLQLLDRLEARGLKANEVRSKSRRMSHCTNKIIDVVSVLMINR